MRIYMCWDGLVRFATEPYSKPTYANIKNMCMHLTNYAINKNNNFLFNKDEDDESTGHKWNLPFLWKHFDENGVNSKQV